MFSLLACDLDYLICRINLMEIILLKICAFVDCVLKFDLFFFCLFTGGFANTNAK